MFIKSIKIKKLHILLFSCFCLLLIVIILCRNFYSLATETTSNIVDNSNTSSQEEKKYIKWVELHASLSVLDATSYLDIQSHVKNEEIKYNWIELLACLACKYGGNLNQFKQKDLDAICRKSKAGNFC